jgi:hypothetical protein
MCGRLFTRESLPDTDMRLNTPTSNHTKSVVSVFFIGHAVLDLADILLRVPDLKRGGHFARVVSLGKWTS